MYSIYIRKGLVLLTVLFLVFSMGPLWAGGSQEAEEAVSEEHHDEEEGHHDDHMMMSTMITITTIIMSGEMVIPHIEPADLGAGESLRVVASTSIVGDVCDRSRDPPQRWMS